MKSSLLTLPLPFDIKMIPKLGGIKKLFSSREKGDDDDAMSRGQGQIPKMVGELAKANTSTGQLPGVDQHPFYLPCWSPTQQHSFLQTYQYYCPRTPDWYSNSFFCLTQQHAVLLYSVNSLQLFNSSNVRNLCKIHLTIKTLSSKELELNSQ